ncbi:LLM class flavin-dependent oxidoreductase [Natrinema gelatinilyticum]|uniref:LLM class flavin-dependent oxidoreductase n=1 Tax=Natrinema gelatinilyticum TaxID=2961571 RepID=UPI0020C4918A|nr:LLM class flavin-dependent oxidoreductase [Natrinema gelatinilyticum]
MKFGFFPTEGGAEFDVVLDQAKLAESVGFDSCWVCEHHESPENYWPAPFTRLASVATATEDLEIVTAVAVTPLHNAVEVAENALVLDQISEGRFTLGVAAGYVPAEFNAYGVSMEERFPRFVESVQLLDRYLSADDSFSFDGEFWTLEDWQPIPTSRQEPRPPLIVGGWGEKALERAVRLGDGWMPGGTADLESLVYRQQRLYEIADDDGTDPEELVCPLMREVVIGDTRTEAMRLGRRYLHRAYTDEYGTDDWAHPLIDRSTAAEFETLAEDRFFVGSPNDIIAQIQRFRDRFDTDHIGCRFHFPGMDPETVRRQIELFGDDVIPSFS